MKRAAVLASGKGSNLAALLAAQDAFPSYRIVLAVSNIEGCVALDVARSAAVEAAALPSRHDSRLLRWELGSKEAQTFDGPLERLLAV